MLSQVTGNTAGQGGGIFAVPGSPVTLKLTLIASNTPGQLRPARQRRGLQELTIHHGSF